MADTRITDAEIAGYMGWRGPGAYTEASLRKIREIIDHVLRVERATPPSPSTAPEVDERAAFEVWAREQPAVSLSLLPESAEGMGVYRSGHTQWLYDGWQARSALASRPAEVDEARKPPRTPEEIIAFVGSHFDAMRDETSDPEDIRFTLSVHDLLSAMSDWFESDEGGAEACGREVFEQAKTRMDTSSQPVVEVAQEVDDEGLPPLPDAFGTMENVDGEGHTIGWVQGYTAEQYRQGQRDAVAADRARREKGGA